MDITKEALHKWRHTAREISDDELKALLKYFRGIKRALGATCPPEYMLVLQDVNRQLDRLEFTKASRKEKW